MIEDLNDLKHEYSIILPLNLQFFANDEGGEKTEEPTAKKIRDARKEGQVAKSKELVISVSLLALFLSLRIFIGYLYNGMLSAFYNYYQLLSTLPLEKAEVPTTSGIIKNALWDMILLALPLVVIALVVTIAINIFQVKWEPTLKPLQPKLSRLNPIKGFSHIFNKSKIFELVKDVIKIAIIFYITYSTLKSDADKIKILYDLDLLPAVMYIGSITLNLGIKISAFYFIIGIIDYIYQYFKLRKDLRMSKQEIKDEFKQDEGDPKVKSVRQQKMQEASRRRMMSRVPDADVVITNPTHYACAILYDKDTNQAPVLVAKGADYVAQKIKEIAKESDVPIVENKPLARLLYFNVEIDEEIPKEYYQLTAEVLAYVYNLKNKTT